jgi:hypothetical protein
MLSGDEEGNVSGSKETLMNADHHIFGEDTYQIVKKRDRVLTF